MMSFCNFSQMERLTSAAEEQAGTGQPAAGTAVREAFQAAAAAAV